MILLHAFLPVFFRQNDQLVLEDESGRVSLSGEISAADLVTGVTIAVRGRVSNDDLGVFQVKGCLFCHPILSPNSELTPPVRDVMSFASEEKEAKYLCLVSGLRIGAECGKDKAPSSIAARLLFSFLAGRLGSANSREVARRVVRTVIAGDSIAEGPSREKIKDNKYFPNTLSSKCRSSIFLSYFQKQDVFLDCIVCSCIRVRLTARTTADQLSSGPPPRGSRSCQRILAAAGSSVFL